MSIIYTTIMYITFPIGCCSASNGFYLQLRSPEPLFSTLRVPEADKKETQRSRYCLLKDFAGEVMRLASTLLSLARTSHMTRAAENGKGWYNLSSRRGRLWERICGIWTLLRCGDLKHLG